MNCVFLFIYNSIFCASKRLHVRAPALVADYHSNFESHARHRTTFIDFSVTHRFVPLPPPPSSSLQEPACFAESNKIVSMAANEDNYNYYCGGVNRIREYLSSSSLSHVNSHAMRSLIRELRRNSFSYFSNYQNKRRKSLP